MQLVCVARKPVFPSPWSYSVEAKQSLMKLRGVSDASEIDDEINEVVESIKGSSVSLHQYQQKPFYFLFCQRVG